MYIHFTRGSCENDIPTRENRKKRKREDKRNHWPPNCHRYTNTRTVERRENNNKKIRRINWPTTKSKYKKIPFTSELE